MIIYKITNIENKKIYIGRTINSLRQRKNKHLSLLRKKFKPNSHFQLAFNKYGEKSFVFEEIEVCSSIGELDARERFWIKYFQSNNPNFGYNETEGGDGLATLNQKKRMEIGRKVSQKLTGRHLTREHKERIGIANKGKIVSEKVKQKLSKLFKQRYADGEMPYLKPNFLSGINHGMYGKTHSKEARKKISAAREGKTYSEIFGEQKAKEIIQEKSQRYTGAGNPFFKEIDIDYVKTQLDKGRNLCDIAIEIGVSRPTILDKFKKKYEISIQDYKQRNRIE